MQDLSGFSVPKGFRGGNAIKVQFELQEVGERGKPTHMQLEV